jgi:hypothetical protein
MMENLRNVRAEDLPTNSVGMAQYCTALPGGILISRRVDEGIFLRVKSEKKA